MNKDSFVTLYVYKWCGYSKLAMDLCKQYKLKHKVHDMDKIGGKEHVISELKKNKHIARNSRHSTAPIVFIDAKFIGGCDKFQAALAEMK